MEFSMSSSFVIFDMHFASIYLFGPIARAVAQSVSTASTSISAIATHTVAVGEVNISS
jgi:hypothetical protein